MTQQQFDEMVQAEMERLIAAAVAAYEAECEDEDEDEGEPCGI